jgi:UDP-N-acetylmuramate dehydrogenase
MIYKNISLRNYNTFGLDYKAERFITVETEEEAISIFEERECLKKPLLIIGGGSNLLFTDDFKGSLVHSGIGEIRIEETTQGDVIISAGSGIIWDELVEWSVRNEFSGIENLSLIPGLTGASPIQNIGAYGVEIRDVIIKVRTISAEDGSLREFSNDECRFDYRNSIFKGEMKGKYFVTRVYFKLQTTPGFKLGYGLLYDEVKKLGEINIRNVREAVINIRRSKLPDPQITGNAGSFFKNPVVDSGFAKKLIDKHPQMPVYTEKNGKIKIAAGWLIEQCGWKGRRIGDAAVHDKQALVLVNLGKATGKDIFKLSENIRHSVNDKFGIEMEREVEVIGSI